MQPKRIPTLQFATAATVPFEPHSPGIAKSCLFSDFFGFVGCGMPSANKELRRKPGERVLMKNLQVQCKEKTVSGGSKKLIVEWAAGEPFSLPMQQGSSFRLGPKTNIERTYYVKLGIDFPDNRFDRSPLWVRGHRRHRCVDRASIIRGLSRAVYSLAHLWASKGCLKSGPVNRTPNQRLQTQVNLPLEASKGGLS